MRWALDEAQKDAVESTDRAVMVVAGPGTGKTRVLTARAAWLTEEAGVDPGKILAITYTNRAAGEMRSRLALRGHEAGETTGSPAGDVAVLTFHSWAYRLVRKHAVALGFPHEPVVFDEDATEQLLRRLLGEKRIPEEVLPIRYLKQLLDRVKAQIACPLWDKRIPPENLEEVTDVLRGYHEQLKYRGALDFADILLCALELLICFPDVREQVSGGIEHLLIDEFQDINFAQYELVETLATPEMHLFAVGDEDQTIYAFRGSSGEFIDRFVADFNARLIPLGMSYRCSSGILYAAGTLIGKNRRFYLQPPRPPADLKEKPPISLFEVEDEGEEARLVAKLVRSWTKAGCALKNIAILYRVHSLADECERVLLEEGIPTFRVTPERQREELPGDPLPILRLAVTDIEWDWDRALGLPRDRLGELDDLRVRVAALKERVSVATLLGRPAKFRTLSPLAQAQLAKLNSFVKGLKKEAKNQAPSTLLRMVADHMEASRSPWRPNEDAMLATEEESLEGFDHLSPAALLEEWRKSSGGIRICHAPTVSALVAARLIDIACTEIVGIKSEMIPLGFEGDERSASRDNRPVVVVGLNRPPDEFFSSDSLFHRALYVTPSGVSIEPAETQGREESFRLALAAHRLAAELVGWRPGGAPDEEIVFLDLETTGADVFRADIVELAAIRVHLRDGRPVELGHFHSLVNPGCPIPSAAVAVHGITDDDVRDAPSLRDILPRFLDFLGDSPLAGHNIISYDLPILRRHAGKLLERVIPNLALDTLLQARRLFPGKPNTLGAVAERLGVKVAQAHRALDDVRVNIGIFDRMIALDEASRARAFSKWIPLALAIALAVDDSAEIDPAWIQKAAARSLASSAGDTGHNQFANSILERLSLLARKNIAGLLVKLAKHPFEWNEDESVLRARIDFLLEEAVRLERDRPDVTLAEYLAHIALLTDGDFESEEDTVRMMTLHAAKGLEFDRVVILGLEQGNLPHRLAMSKTVAEIEEERRLCYVGLTRARERAALMYARRRFGRWRPPSMFLAEIPSRAIKRFHTKDKVKGR